MIQVTHFHGNIFYLNAELIQTVESTPDTVITLTNNTKILVKETAELVVERIIAYRRKVYSASLDILKEHEGWISEPSSDSSEA